MTTEPKVSTNKDNVFVNIAMSLALLSTCPRRFVGCVLVDKNYRIIGSGYNGVPRGVDHCHSLPCPFANDMHGTPCWATHAEVNAIAQCQNVDKVWTVFTTSFPCLECFKLIMNTGCRRVVYQEDYPSTRPYVEELNSAANAIKFVHAARLVGSAARRGSSGPHPGEADSF